MFAPFTHSSIHFVLSPLICVCGGEETESTSLFWTAAASHSSPIGCSSSPNPPTDRLMAKPCKLLFQVSNSALICFFKLGGKRKNNGRKEKSEKTLPHSSSIHLFMHKKRRNFYQLEWTYFFRHLCFHILCFYIKSQVWEKKKSWKKATEKSLLSLLWPHFRTTVESLDLLAPPVLSLFLSLYILTLTPSTPKLPLPLVAI